VYINAGALETLAAATARAIALGRAQDAVHCMRIDLAGIVLEARFDDPDAAFRFARRYRHMPASAAPDVVAYAVAPARGDHYFWIDGGPAYRWNRNVLEAGGIAFMLDAVATSAVFALRADRLTLHAAAVGDGHGVAAIVGTSEAGKTTTAIACARRGLALYSDEFCVVTPAGVIAVPRTLGLRAEGVALLARSAAPPSPVDAFLRAYAGGDRESVGYDEIFGAVQVPAPAPLRSLFFVAERAAEPRAQAISASAMLPRVAPWTRAQARGAQLAPQLLALLKQIACYELVLGTPDATAQLVSETLCGARETVRA
jgi:hypothetical protein